MLVGKYVHGVNLKLGLGVSLVHDPFQFASSVYASQWRETATPSFRIVV